MNVRAMACLAMVMFAASSQAVLIKTMPSRTLSTQINSIVAANNTLVDDTIDSLLSLAPHVKDKLPTFVGNMTLVLRKGDEQTDIKLARLFSLPDSDMRAELELMKGWEVKVEDASEPVSDDIVESFDQPPTPHDNPKDNMPAVRIGPAVEAFMEVQHTTGQTHAVVTPTGNTGEPDEWAQAFLEAQSTRDNAQIGKFIRHLIKHRGAKLLDQRSLAGIAPYYSGRRAAQSYDRLLVELRAAAWIADFK